MIRFELPSLGADMDEGTLLEWKVKPGDAVSRGQIIAVVDTSKAAVDIEIWHAGVIGELLVEPGSKIPVGTPMATVLEPGEAPPARAEAPGEAAAKPPAKGAAKGAAKAPAKAPAEARVAAPAEAPAKAPAETPTRAPGPRAVLEAARHPVSPAARRRGRELGVDVEALAGTGAGGAVTIADVERAASEGASLEKGEARAAGPQAPTRAQVEARVQAPAEEGARPQRAAVPGAAPGAVADRQREMRRAIAAAMSRSKREIPHYYLSESIPMLRALDWLAQRNAQRPIAERLLVAVLQLKAVAFALRETPELNGVHRDGEFVPSAAAHVGVAIALRGGGLVAPAIHDVGEKPLDQLMRELADLVRRARAGSLRSSEMSDPTITVTNLGDQGVESVAGVIYPPQVALVGFGRIADRAWAQDGWVRAIPVVTASLAADHRVSDGHRGARFLAALREQLQRPEELDTGS